MYHPLVWCKVSAEGMVHCRKSQNRLLPSMVKMWRRAESLKEAAKMMGETDQEGRRRWALKEVLSLLFEQPLAKRPSFLKKMCARYDLELEDLYSIFTSEAFHRHYVKVSKLLKNCLIQYLSSEKICSSTAGPSGEQKRLRLLKMPLMTACHGILAHNEKKFALPKSRLSFAKR